MKTITEKYFIQILHLYTILNEIVSNHDYHGYNNFIIDEENKVHITVFGYARQNMSGKNINNEDGKSF